YRSDAAAQVQAGDTLSVWVRFAGSANGRAYFGFGASSAGTLSLVAAPNTGQLILQQNSGFGFTDLAAVGQGYQANKWYRLEVDWGVSGTIIGKLFDSNGTTLLRTVTASTTAFTSGGIAFRGIGNSKYFDTVTGARGVTPSAVSATPPGGLGAGLSRAAGAVPPAGLGATSSPAAGNPVTGRDVALAVFQAVGAPAGNGAPFATTTV